MTDIKMLMEITPCYGETLIGVGGIMLSIGENVLRNNVAREEICEYLTCEECPYGDISLLMFSSIWEILDKYIDGKRPFIGAVKSNEKIIKGIPVEIELIELFKNKIFPILVKAYTESINYNKERVTCRIKITGRTYSKLYKVLEGSENVSDVFFDEFKELLLYNYIVITKADLEENGDMKFELMMPIPPVMKI